MEGVTGEARMLGRVLDQIADHARSGRRNAMGGLLIGRIDGGAFIEKALPCPNLLRAEEGYAIDPQIVENVRRSLNGAVTTILGGYRASVKEGAHTPLATLGVAGSAEPVGPLQLEVVVAEGSVTHALRTLATSVGTEVPVRIIRPSTQRLVTCPE
jgi:hypothetical protein